MPLSARILYVWRVKTDIFAIVSVVGAQNFEYKYGDGYKHLASGLVCGLSSLVSYNSIYN